MRADEAIEAGRALLARLGDAGAEPAPPRRLSWIAPCPADPGDITLSQLRALNEADVLMHDARVSEAVLSLARRDADRRPLDMDRHEDAGSREARVLTLCAGYRHAVALVA